MLRTYAPNGAPMLDLGDRIAKFLGVATVGWNFTGSQRTGQIVDGRFTQYPNARPFAFLIDGALNSPRFGALELSISGNILTWRFPTEAAESYTRTNTSFAYGFY